MKSIAALILIAACAIGCVSAGTPVPENGFRFTDQDTQRDFASGLRRGGIPFRMREDGTVLYSPNDESRVSDIRMRVLNESFVPSARVNDPALERQFLERLDSAGIRYAIHEKTGTRWITWAERDGAKVDEIRRKLLDAR